MIFPPPGDQLRRDNANILNLKVTPQNIPNMTVKINPGFFWMGTKYVEFAGASSPSIAAPSANAKYVIVCLTEAGGIRLVDGTASVSPVLPQVPPKYLPLAFLYIERAMTSITDAAIYDIRPLWGGFTFEFNHNFLGNRADVDCHTIDSITDLRTELDNRSPSADLNVTFDNKADIDGTPSTTFTLNKDKSGSPDENCSITVNRGSNPDVSFTWDENLDRWTTDQDIMITDTTKGIILVSPNGSKFRITINDAGQLLPVDVPN